MSPTHMITKLCMLLMIQHPHANLFRFEQRSRVSLQVLPATTLATLSNNEIVTHTSYIPPIASVHMCFACVVTSFTL